MLHKFETAKPSNSSGEAIHPMLSHSHPFWGPGAREVQPRCHGGNASLKIKSLLLSRCLVMMRRPWGPAWPRVRNCLGKL